MSSTSRYGVQHTGRINCSHPESMRNRCYWSVVQSNAGLMITHPEVDRNSRTDPLNRLTQSAPVPASPRCKRGDYRSCCLRTSTDCLRPARRHSPRVAIGFPEHLMTLDKLYAADVSRRPNLFQPSYRNHSPRTDRLKKPGKTCIAHLAPDSTWIPHPRKKKSTFSP